MGLFQLSPGSGGGERGGAGAAADASGPSTESADFRPIAVLEVELSGGLCSLLGHPVVRAARSGEQGAPAQALVLVRLHSAPLGLTVLDLTAEQPASSWTVAVLDRLGPALEEHLASDDIPRRTSAWLGVRVERPACLAERRAALAKAPPASVVVATHERPDRLAKCVASLRAQAYPDFEIVVADNAPRTPATKDLVESWARVDRRVRYVREDEQGLGAAHNAGLVLARGDILAFTDDDVIADRHWLAELVTPFVADAHVGGATGLILPAELATAPQLMLEAHGRFGKGFAPRQFDLDEHRPGDRLFPFTAGRLGSGANMAFEAAQLRALGGFDPALGTGTKARGGDDLDAIFRLVSSGRALAYRPGAIVWHHHRREMEALARQAYGYGVGLGAYLASIGFRDPRRLLEMAVRLPSASAYALAHTAPEAIAGADLASTLQGVPPWPRQLARLQRRGLLVGPADYLLSRRAHRRRERRVDRAGPGRS
jgi:GT2 family glycosyltransferase